MSWTVPQSAGRSALRSLWRRLLRSLGGQLYSPASYRPV